MPRRVFVRIMSRSEQLESEGVGPVDATMAQTLSRVMSVDGEEFDDKYVTIAMGPASCEPAGVPLEPSLATSAVLRLAT